MLWKGGWSIKPHKYCAQEGKEVCRSEQTRTVSFHASSPGQASASGRTDGEDMSSEIADYIIPDPYGVMWIPLEDLAQMVTSS